MAVKLSGWPVDRYFFLFCSLSSFLNPPVFSLRVTYPPARQVGQSGLGTRRLVKSWHKKARYLLPLCRQVGVRCTNHQPPTVCSTRHEVGGGRAGGRCAEALWG